MFNLFSKAPSAEFAVKSHEIENGKGFSIIRTKDKQELRWRTLPISKGLFSANIAGTSHREEEIQNKAFAPGKKLKLVPEPQNEYDKNAIAVFDKSGKIQAGYLPKEDAEKFSKKLSSGEQWNCYSIWETVKKNKRVNLRVLLVAEDTKVKGLS